MFIANGWWKAQAGALVLGAERCAVTFCTALLMAEIDTLNIELKKAQDECSLLKVENANLSADSEKRCIEMEQVREAGLEAERKKHESELREVN